ncbi:MAG: helicase RepA family protein [Sulfuricella sp.]
MGIDILSAFQTEPPALDFVWPGLLSGTVGGLVSPGGAGKSFWALEAAMGVAAPGGDLLELSPQGSGRVMYLAAEDPEPVLRHRLHAIGKHRNQAAREQIAENLSLIPILGQRLDLMDKRHLAWVVEQGEGARLIVLDTLSRVHRLDENSNSDMAQLVSGLEHIAVTTGAAVLFLHHTSKGSAQNGQLDQQQAARGASSLVDNARWAGFIAKMTEDESKKLSNRVDRQPIGDRRGFFVRFGVSKQNYGLPQADGWYERHDGGVLLPVDLVPANSKPKANKGENDDWE